MELYFTPTGTLGGYKPRSAQAEHRWSRPRALFLCLLGNLRLLQISRGHCYLRGATGPKYGALLMVTGTKQGTLCPEIEQTVLDLQNHLGVRVQVMEDVLWNWQKKPNGTKGREPEKGFLSVCC